METSSHNISAAFNGNAGIATGYMRNAQNNLHTDAYDLQSGQTAMRTAQLQKVAFCHRFIKAFAGTGFFNKSFPACGSNNNGYNHAAGILLNQVIAGTCTNRHLDYSQLLISKGKLPPAAHAGAAAMLDGNIYFSYTDNSDAVNAYTTDKVILVAYSEVLQRSVFCFNAGRRKDCEAVLETAMFKGYSVETWMGFISNDEMHASNSVWTGKIKL